MAIVGILVVVLLIVMIIYFVRGRLAVRDNFER